MIHEEFCTYEVCKLAKEKGFDEATYYTYDEESKRLNRMRYCVKRNSRIGSIIKLIAAPTQSLLQRWLREEKGYYVYPLFDNVQLMWDWVCREKTGDKWIPLVGLEFHLFPTYELALEDALKYTLENLA